METLANGRLRFSVDELRGVDSSVADEEELLAVAALEGFVVEVEFLPAPWLDQSQEERFLELALWATKLANWFIEKQLSLNDYIAEDIRIRLIDKSGAVVLDSFV
jgi:hypothetical protein